MRVGERIRILRYLRNMTQSDLAKAAGVHQTRLSRIESNVTADPGVQTMGRIARALGVPLTALVDDDAYVAALTGLTLGAAEDSEAASGGTRDGRAAHA